MCQKEDVSQLTCNLYTSPTGTQVDKTRSKTVILICWIFTRFHYKTETFLCSRQRPPWTSPPQVFTSVHLLKKFVGSRFTISSPRFQNNWVKIHLRKKWDRSRFTKVKVLLRPRFTSLPKKLASYLAKISA